MKADKKIQLHHEDRGEGDGILLIHGFGGNICSWRHFMPALGQSRRAVAIDLMGHGDSPKPDNFIYSVDNQARVVLEECDRLLMNRFIVCGHSYGGAVALQLARKLNLDPDTSTSPENQDRLQGLIIISGAAYPQELPWHLKGMKSPYSVKINEVMNPTAQIQLVLLKLFYNPLKITREIISDYAAPMRSPGYHKALHETVKHLIPPDAHELSSIYRQIKLPALLIWGEKDSVVPPEIGEKLHLDLHNSVFHVLPDCGHMPMHEKPVEVLNLILNWLESLN